VFLGIDLGTSAVKALLVDDEQRIVDQQSAPLESTQPAPLWSEQDPEHWWRATNDALAQLRARSARALSGVRAVGLSGQMHGATLLGADDQPLRPAILWNDGRSASECRELEAMVPDARQITGNLAMPGFTAPKLLWVRRHEPDLFARIHSVLLPKDFVRLRMTGERASDLSDSSGTLWLDVARRRWSEAMLDACGLSLAAMPMLFEGSDPSGMLLPQVAESWGVPVVPVAAGAGDQAAGAIGAGVIHPGDASLSLGTSGVYFVSGERFAPNPEQAVHAFCHALPDSWHQMSVILSAASCLSWLTGVVGAASEAALLAEIEAADRPSQELLFLPYLTGERTPHNDPNASGVFIGLRPSTDAAALGRAVLEGVAFAFADAQAALLAGASSTAFASELSVIGGGARSALWGRILASALDRKLIYREGAEVGPAFGAARLARLALGQDDPARLCTPPPIDFEVAPDPALRDEYAEGLAAFRHLYSTLRPHFSAGGRRLGAAG
jgi:xylulokinase